MTNEDNPSSMNNLEYWKNLQDEEDYFDKHPIYSGLREFSLSDYGGYDAVEAISLFLNLNQKSNVVVIGCGYGRETLQIAPRVKHVWGIDVSKKLLEKTKSFLSSRNVNNFTPVLASDYDKNIPCDIDLVFSVVVMQHLSRSLVKDYFCTLQKHLSPDGVFVVQFLEELYEGVETRDAEMRVYEPSISWTVSQLAQLSIDCGVKFNEIRTQMLGSKTLWHWVYFAKDVP